MVGDVTTGVIEYALRGLAQRADVRAHNVANQATPGFRATRVDFESALRDALAGSRSQPAAAPAVLPAASLPDPHGNTVNLEDELVGMVKDNLARDALVNAYNARMGRLRSVIGGGR